MTNMYINNKGWQFQWTENEDEIVKKFYPKNGYIKVQEFLPNRNKKSIQQRAHKLGVKYLTYNMNYFDYIDTPTKAYWLGFLYADGYVTTSNRWGLELSALDIEHMENLLSDMNCNLNIKTRIRNGYEYCSFQIKNTTMFNSLNKNGVVMNKTNNLIFPPEEILNKNFYSHFIRGFFDGDGCITFAKNKNDNLVKNISIVCKSEGFVRSILSILSEQNITLNYSVNTRDDLPTIQVASKSEIVKFLNYIYNNSDSKNRLHRKYSKSIQLLDRMEVVVQDVS